MGINKHESLTIKMGMYTRKDKDAVCLIKIFPTLLLLLLLLPAALAEDQDPLHTNLRNHLLMGYNKNLIPMKNSSNAVEIALGIALIHIDSLEEAPLHHRYRHHHHHYHRHPHPPHHHHHFCCCLFPEKRG